jgi:transcriptional regulator with XRE-family HTH domain
MNEIVSQNSKFTERYNEMLSEFRLTPKGLADRLGDKGHVKYNNYQKGDGMPSAETLAAIALQLDISLDWLLLGVGSMTRQEPQEVQVLGNNKSQLPARQQAMPALVDEDKVKTQAENEGLKKQIELLEKQNENLWRLALSPQIEKELGFLASSSCTTASDHMPLSRRAAGFRQQANDDLIEEVLNEAKVIQVDWSTSVERAMYPGTGEGIRA